MAFDFGQNNYLKGMLSWLHYRHLLCKCPTWPGSRVELAWFPAMHSDAIGLESVFQCVNNMMLSALLGV